MYVARTVYQGRNNVISLALRINGVPIDHTTLTRIILYGDNAAFTLDSNVTPSYFDYTNAAYLNLKLGAAVPVSISIGSHTLQLVTFDSTNTSGLWWPPRLYINAVNQDTPFLTPESIHGP